jgi:hypothetical protein
LDAVQLKGFWCWDDDSDHAVVLVVDDSVHDVLSAEYL